jgi:hypothetical protein
MSDHVFARVSGFGWTLLPRAPFWLEQVGGPRTLLVEHNNAAGLKRATLRLDESPPGVDLDEGTTSLQELLDLLPGPGLDHWQIETTVFTLPWPDGFAVQSSPDPPGFDLLGADNTLVYVQGPFDRTDLPAPRAMAATDQTIVRHGPTWVDLAYTDGGKRWRQTHRVVDLGEGVVLVVTSQAPEKLASVAEKAGEAVAAGVRPY